MASDLGQLGCLQGWWVSLGGFGLVQPGFGVGFLLVGFQICCLGWQVTRVAVLGGQVVTGGQVCVGARARLWVGSWVGGKWTGCSCFLIGWAGSGQAAFCVLVTVGVVGLLNSLAQALCRHCWISSFRPPPVKRGIIVVIIVGLFGWTPFGWTPRLSLLKGKANFHSLRPFSLHNDILYERPF